MGVRTAISAASCLERRQQQSHSAISNFRRGLYVQISRRCARARRSQNRLLGAMVAHLTPDQKVAGSSPVGVTHPIATCYLQRSRVLPAHMNSTNARLSCFPAILIRGLAPGLLLTRAELVPKRHTGASGCCTAITSTPADISSAESSAPRAATGTVRPHAHKLRSTSSRRSRCRFTHMSTCTIAKPCSCGDICSGAVSPRSPPAARSPFGTPCERWIRIASAVLLYLLAPLLRCTIRALPCVKEKNASPIGSSRAMQTAGTLKTYKARHEDHGSFSLAALVRQASEGRSYQRPYDTPAHPGAHNVTARSVLALRCCLPCRLHPCNTHAVPQLGCPAR